VSNCAKGPADPRPNDRLATGRLANAPARPAHHRARQTNGDHFLKTRPVCPQPFAIAPEALTTLQRYDWPGNVRELANVLERAQVLAEAHTITPDDLPDTVRATRAILPDKPGNPLSLEAMERRLVREALEQTHGNKLAAARTLGISLRTLYRMIERYSLGEWQQ
jgi:two-component system response regulator AtoC